MVRCTAPTVVAGSMVGVVFMSSLRGDPLRVALPQFERRRFERLLLRSRRLRRLPLREQALDERGVLGPHLLVKRAARLAGETGVRAAHAPVTPEEERRRERV